LEAGGGCAGSSGCARAAPSFRPFRPFRPSVLPPSVLSPVRLFALHVPWITPVAGPGRRPTARGGLILGNDELGPPDLALTPPPVDGRPLDSSFRDPSGFVFTRSGV